VSKCILGIHGEKKKCSDVSPSQITSKKEITILKLQVHDDVLSSPGHHMLRTGTAFIDYVAGSPVTHGSV